MHEETAQLQPQTPESSGQNRRRYWRSLDDLSRDREALRRLGDEFAPDADVWLDPVSRRNFLAIMGASLALAGVVGCGDFPDEKILPYVNQPESVVPGKPTFYATTVPLGGYGFGALVESHEGRPTKIEGNPDHPASLGATHVFMQASVLDLYDPDRSKQITHGGIASTWGALYAELSRRLELEQGSGEGIRILTRTITSPTFAAQLADLRQKFPKLRWHVYDPTVTAGCSGRGGVGGGPPGQAVYDFSKADVILTLDADFLANDPGSLAYARQFADQRRRDVDLSPDQQRMNRLYAVESTLSITGSMADHRRAVKPSQIMRIAGAIAARLGVTGQDSAAPAGFEKFVEAVADDLKNPKDHAGSGKGVGVVVAGDHQSRELQELVFAMNSVLGAIGTAVRYIDPPEVQDALGIEPLVAAMNAGSVKTLLILGGNPVYDAPADLGFKSALEAMTTAGQGTSESRFFTAHLGSHEDETSFSCQWHLPEAHYLEAWGDIRAYDGTASIIQPLILPMSPAARSICEIMEALAGRPDRSGYEAVRTTWQKSWEQSHPAPPPTQPANSQPGQPEAGSQSQASTWVWPSFLSTVRSEVPPVPSPAESDRTEKTAGEGTGGTGQKRRPHPTPFEQWWQLVLRSGTLEGSAFPAVAVNKPGPAATANGREFHGPGSWEILFRPDPTTWDGQYANNGWLQELPKPFTKLVWDNAAWISHGSAKKLGVKDGHVVRVTLDGRILDVPVVIVPGMPDETLTLSLGYGRWRAGRVADAGSGASRGYNAYGLRTSQSDGFGGGATVEPVPGQTRELVMTRSHHAMDGVPGGATSDDSGKLAPNVIEHPGMTDDQIEIHNRRLLRAATLEEFRTDENWVTRLGGEGEMRAKGLSQDFPGRKIHLSLYPTNAADGGWDYSTGHQWAMSIDQNTCIGCNACVIACQAENNIAIVGKDECSRQREMHWIRIDSWFGPHSGQSPADGVNDPEIIHMPVPCQHCENAPCEVVCPVGATTHSVEGLNEMTYNRCIGTRYCSNNCPYKVRRFNFLLFSDYEPTRALQYNPDVTVRSRGVMEKCTYCVQRLNRTRMEIEKLTVRLEERANLIEHESPDRAKALRDSLPKQQKQLLDQLQTACQQACPTRAIVFGDKNAPGSAVAKLKQDKLDYTLLADLTTQPRTSYMARLRNPNPVLS